MSLTHSLMTAKRLKILLNIGGWRFSPHRGNGSINMATHPCILWRWQICSLMPQPLDKAIEEVRKSKGEACAHNNENCQLLTVTRWMYDLQQALPIPLVAVKADSSGLAGSHMLERSVLFSRCVLALVVLKAGILVGLVS